MAEQEIAEIWKSVEVPDYEVSSLGRVRRASTGRVLKPGRDRDGYARFNVSLRVAVLVCRAFQGPAPTAKHEAAHGDGSKDNDQADNLSWKTQKENAADKERHGRTVRGEKHALAKFTEAEVLAILERLVAGVPMQQLATEYGVAKQTIFRIKKREAWKHLQPLTQPVVKANPRSLTEESVREIRRLLRQGSMTHTAIGRLFGVSRPCISGIHIGRLWPHVTDTTDLGSERCCDVDA